MSVRKIERLLKRMFGYSDINSAIQDKDNYKEHILNVLGIEDINKVNFDDLKKKKLCLLYARYVALKNILKNI